MKKSVVVIGGGLAGLAVTSRLRKQFDVTVIEPSETHLYQPGLTLLGTGIMDEKTYRHKMIREEARVMPKGVTWLKTRVSRVDPENNLVETDDGQLLRYDYLVVATGIELRWDLIPGLKEAVFDETAPVISVCSLPTATLMNRKVQKMPRGRLLVTTPATPIKCGGVPKKVAFLLSDRARQQGLTEDDMQVEFAWTGTVMNDVPRFGAVLDHVADDYGVVRLPQHELVSVDSAARLATFRLADGTIEERSFDLLHAVPPMTAPGFIRNSGLANEAGFVDVNINTLQHLRFSNVFGIGDSAGVPTARTGAAVRKQAPVLVKNLIAQTLNEPLTASYDGYSCCPVLTRVGRVVLMEFRYGNEAVPSVPWNSVKESWLSWFLKTRILCPLYWHAMLPGLV